MFGEQISGIYTCNEWKPHTDKYKEIMNDENKAASVCLHHICTFSRGFIMLGL